MKGLVFGALKLFQPALQYVSVIAGKYVKMAFLIAIVLYGFATIGLLPRSPFRVLNELIIGERHSFMRYLMPFLPIVEMISVLTLWVIAILVWYGVKLILRLAKIIT